ncbi:NAD(P)/FAD-dependent oxidoreductase [Citricoccus sp. SGAir0253]|uniref:flavin-containing monooxygenase n=1 Tax=Citricoccus sp. SGAir0253 TaxID=2567881 RepID=UPI0010CD66D5|nr:NAD(P)/FAD-dependent oxidoreductase [Citricoccus sp. SGAir0253]QCU77119.1 NAD(P)/FAD-dependent oxidoreductase [Citricoccus sp. SGAir0253]
MTPQPAAEYADVLIVGAGLSGIDAAHRIRRSCPELSVLVLEARERIGGTWDLFRYPGVRSDSDMYTLAFPFHPWTGPDSIVEGERIRRYLLEAAERTGVDRLVRTGTRVTAAHWSSAERRWRVDAVTGAGPEGYAARFIVLCTGYYDYDRPHDPGIKGLADVAGTVAHPQSWPRDLDVTGRRVAVIGSGATAVSLVPALAAAGARVTMLQRTPGYVLPLPRRDAVAEAARRVLPGPVAHRAVRARNAAQQWALYRACRRAPRLMRRLLRGRAVDALGSEALVDEHFTPPYDPWDQRLCVDPDGELYAAIRAGRVDVVTGEVDRCVPEGVRLADGTVVEAEVVVPATGLALLLLGGVGLTVDGAAVEPSSRHAYYGAMLSGVPNLAFCIGYLNQSWTLRSDLAARFIARVLRRLLDRHLDAVVPEVPADVGPSHPLMSALDSGYLRRAAHLMPRATDRYPWAMAQDLVRDGWALRRADLDEGLRWIGPEERGEAAG